MSKRNLQEAARAAQKHIDADELTVEAMMHLRQSIRQRCESKPMAQRRTLLWMACATAATVVLAVWIGRKPATQTDFRVLAGADCVVERSRGMSVKERCPSKPEIELSDALLTLDAGSDIAVKPKGVRVKRGRVAFKVGPRTTQRPRFEAQVSAGTVVVISTQFTIDERGDSGTLTVTEGAVEFRWADGRSSDQVRAGMTLSWPQRDTSFPALEDDEDPGSLPAEPPTRRDRSPPNAKRHARAVLQEMFPAAYSGPYGSSDELAELR